MLIKKDMVNLSALALIQGANALFPLIVFPYLFKTLGAAVFADVVTTESVILITLVFCLYSFDVLGVKDVVGIKAGEGDYLLRYHWTVVLIRLLILAVLGGAVLFVAGLAFDSYVTYLWLWLLLPLGVILQSNYLYQALEENHVLAAVVILTRVGACILVFLLVKNAEAAELAVSLVSGSYAVSGLISIGYIFSAKGAKLGVLEFHEIKKLLSAGLDVCLGNIAVVLFRGSNVLILAAVSTPYAVAVYAVAEKVIKTLQALARPMNQFALPRLVRSLKSVSGCEGAKATIWRYTRVQLIVVVVACPLLLASLYVFQAVFRVSLIEAGALHLASAMVIAVFFGVLNYMYGVAGLNVLGLTRYYARSIVLTGLITIAVSLVASATFAQYGAAFGYVFGEVVLFGFVYFRFVTSPQAVANA